MSKFLLEVVTPERKVYAEEADMIIAKGVEGDLGILPQHIPLVTPLKIGPLVIKKSDGDEHMPSTAVLWKCARTKLSFC